MFAKYKKTAEDKFVRHELMARTLSPRWILRNAICIYSRPDFYSRNRSSKGEIYVYIIYCYWICKESSQKSQGKVTWDWHNFKVIFFYPRYMIFISTSFVTLHRSLSLIATQIRDVDFFEGSSDREANTLCYTTRQLARYSIDALKIFVR